MSYSDLPATRPGRPAGWTVERQQAFLYELAAHGGVAEAAHAVGLSVSSAYRLRAREGAFDFGWRAATALAYERLRDHALDRAVNGVAVPRFYRGAVVGDMTRHSDRLLLGLLNHLRPEGAMNHVTGKRDRATEPAALWAAAVDAYDTARETGADPVTPQIERGAVRKMMTREEFIAAIRMRPRPDPGAADAWEAAAGAGTGTGGAGGAAAGDAAARGAGAEFGDGVGRAPGGGDAVEDADRETPSPA